MRQHQMNNQQLSIITLNQFAMIEDKEQLLNKQGEQTHSRTDSISQNVNSTLPKSTRTRLIRRNRGTTKNSGKKRKRADKMKKSVEECGGVSIAGQNKCNSTCISNENVQIQGFRRQRIQKIVFDTSSFPQFLKQLYENKKKLKNTDLMRPGVKFVKDPSRQLIDKWEKALIVYQQNYKENQRCHFGLLIKYEKRIITFDGVMKLWPIKQVEKSFHWTMQPDTWSCGYRVLFWISQIQNVGLQRWINQKEREVDWNKLPTNIEY